MNISINITYTSGTKVELIVPLEEPAHIVSQPESPVTPEPVQPAQDLADAAKIMLEPIGPADGADYKNTKFKTIEDIIREYKTAPTFPSNKDLDPSGKTMSLYDITYTTQDGKMWKVPPGLMKDLIIIYGEKTVEQELWKAHAWLEADPKRRKTPRGMGRYLNGWLSRASSMVRTPIKTALKRDSLMTNGTTQESW